MFTHLHAHSYFSFSRGTMSPEVLVACAKQAGMTAIALTDTNNLSGAIEFYNAAIKESIKPIIGVELKTRNEEAVLLAKNTEGYRELCETITAVLEAIPQIKPKLTLDSTDPEKVELRLEEESYIPLAPFLERLTENVVILSSYASILEHLAPIRTHDLYIELVPNKRMEWSSLREIERRFRLPFVASNNILFRTKEQYPLHRLLRAIGTNTTIGTVPEWEIGAESQHFVSEQELRCMLSGVSDKAFTTAQAISDECDLTFDFGQPKFATYPAEDPVQYLRTLAEEGFRKRYPKPTGEHRRRFEYELQTIETMNAVSYYLAVWDMIQYATRRNFPYLGRGSGANSLIAYCLNISNVDPVQNGLRFERFLNPERLTPPDFDIDFSWKDRYEVIHYMIDKYGADRAAMLCTVQCYRTKGAVRESGKALGFTDAEINEQIARIRAAYVTRKASSIKAEARFNDIKQWIAWASEIEGFPRNLSVHAGGLLIADKAITHYSPIQQAPSGLPTTQQDMYSADDWKLIKLDILATRGLGTYWDTMNLVEKRYGTRPPVTDERVAFADEPTKELIRSGRTRGCFYIESPAMISLLRKLRTDNFENLTAASSVIRPGVSQSGMMQEFIARHRDPARRKDADPLLAELMPETYGIMVYQEDVLNVANAVAGLSYGEADLMRRAMSGKTRSYERMTDLRDRFLGGCKTNGLTDSHAEDIWRQIVSFSGYSFCKAHSASYAVLSFQKAWLKVYYPAEFMCSVLNNEGGFYSHQEYINEAKLLGVRVKLPDVNRSSVEHSVEDAQTIRLGLRAFSGVSTASIEHLLMAREEAPYRSIEDFAIRSGVTLEDGLLFISLGLCDALGAKRTELLVRFQAAMLASSRAVGRKHNGQQGFDFVDDPSEFALSHLKHYTPLYQFRLERSTFGYSVTNHPSDFLPKNDECIRSTNLQKYVGRTVSIIGYRAASKQVSTRKGDSMLMLNISDHFGMMDVVIWPEQYRAFYTTIANAEALKITGKVSESFGVATLEASNIQAIDFAQYNV